MEAEIRKLPDECWEIIFNKLASDWDSVSLVCKDFLSITNRLKLSLNVFGPSIQVLSKLLLRFPRLKVIQLVGFGGDLGEAVLEIARSQLNLEELDLSCNEDLPAACLEELGSSLEKSLKVLSCSRSSLTDADLVRIADCFPQLEELNISDSCFPHIADDGRTIAVTDEGVEFLSSKLKRLRAVDLSGNQCISDKSLISLSSNCAFIEQIVVGYCRGVTEDGISYLLQNSPNLTSLLLAAHFEIGSFRVNANSLTSLQSLKFARVVISDELLNSIALTQIPLNELTLTFCKGYTFSGISTLLQSYQSLKTLALLGAEFLTNEHINQLSPFLRNLSSIKLHYCPMLSDSAFVMLTERCPLLSCLEMGETGLGQEEWNDNDSPMKNFAIRSLSLSSNSHLSSCRLRRLLSVCPRVEKLGLSNCFLLDEELDVADILESNSTIKRLELDGCRHLKFSETAIESTKLERITAGHSEINDEVLAMLGKNCPGLLHLYLEDCGNITEEGVKEVVKSCTRLRYLNLSDCPNVNVDVVEWIVSKRPSLRRLVSPSHLYPEQEDQDYFLQQGCLVSQGRTYEI